MDSYRRKTDMDKSIVYTFDRTAGVRSPVTVCRIDSVSPYSALVRFPGQPTPVLVPRDELFHTKKEAYQYQRNLIETKIAELTAFSEQLEQDIKETNE